MATIGVIGLGNMGVRMAANLVKAGHSVWGYDIAIARREEASALGVTIVDDMTDVASGTDAVITMLNAGSTVIDVWRRVAARMTLGSLMIDCSSIDVERSRQAHTIARNAGLLSLDAPVSGGVEGAANATLTFMVGGEEAALEAGKPLLAAMGRRIVHCGGEGNGEAAKICNNMILGISMIAVCEAFLLADELGLSRQALFDVSSNASGQCYALTTHCPVPGPVPSSAANHGYQPGFDAALMAKDLKLSQECAGFSGASTPLGAAAASLYEQYVKRDGAGVDYAGILHFLADLPKAGGNRIA